MSAKCARCGRPMPDAAYACTSCGITKPTGWLTEIVDAVPAARDIAHGLTSRGDGGSHGKPESRLPFDLTATGRLDAVQNSLTTWARHVAGERGMPAWDGTESADYLIRAARYLAAHLEWIRHRPEADEFLGDMEAAARVVRGMVRGPAEQRYLGPCGAEIAIGTLDHPDTVYACEGDVYGRNGADKGHCRWCGAEVDQGARRIWLDGKVRASDLAWTARGIADAYGISAKTIRSWATDRYSGDTLIRRAKLSTYWRNGDGQLVPWVEPRPGEDVKARGDRLHYVADVVELARQAAERREAERKRRTAHEAEEASAA